MQNFDAKFMQIILCISKLMTFLLKCIEMKFLLIIKLNLHKPFPNNVFKLFTIVFLENFIKIENSKIPRWRAKRRTEKLLFSMETHEQQMFCNQVKV